MSELIPEYVKAEFMAYTLGISTQWLQKLAAKGAIPKTNGDGYHFLSTVQEYVKYLRNSQQYNTIGDGKDGAKTEGDLKLEKLVVEVQEKKLKMVEKLSQVIPIEIVGREWQSRMLQIMNQMKNSAGRFVDICHEESSRKEAKSQVQMEIKNLLRNIQPPTVVSEDVE